MEEQGKENIYEVISESSRTRSKKKCWLNLILATIAFKIVSLGTNRVIPSFFQCFKSTVEVIFLNAVKYRLRARQFQNAIPSVSFSIWETKRNHRGAKSGE
jgi:hypothetical protein